MENSEQKQAAQRFLEEFKERLPFMFSELLWSAWALDENFRVPPQWVAKAAEKAAGPAIQQIRNLPQLVFGALPLGKAGEFAGEMAVGKALVKTPGPEFEAAAKITPALEDQRKAILKAVEASSEKLAKLSPSEESKLSPLQTNEFLAGQGRGAAAAVKRIDQEDSLTVTICTAIWVFWPKVVLLKNRRALHAWVERTAKMKCSFQLLEKICDEIGFRPAKRGRPKNPTRTKKGVGIKKSRDTVKSGHDLTRPKRKPSG